ncbi:MAG: endonuclease/exonuclease/phosphatase family protein [Patescibacteria group bacterium UBA2163]
MRITSWNIFYKNKRLDDVIIHLARSTNDIICLQEVPEHALPHLDTLPYHMAHQHTFTTNTGEHIYLVTLSRHKITSQKSIAFPSEWYKRPSLFARLLGSCIGWHQPYQDRAALLVTTTINDAPLQILNMHLSVVFVHENVRINEFTKSIATIDATQPHIICGDLNILEQPHVKIINWIMGGSLFKNERALFEDVFSTHHLSNPLRGCMTHWFTRSQLDHILVSEHTTIEQAWVEKNTTGSDHNPVHVHLNT